MLPQQNQTKKSRCNCKQLLFCLLAFMVLVWRLSILITKMLAKVQLVQQTPANNCQHWLLEYETDNLDLIDLSQHSNYKNTK